MKKKRAIELIGNFIPFKRDHVIFADQTNTFYAWKKGDRCKVLGYMEAPDPVLLLGTGSDYFDFHELPIQKIVSELDLHDAHYISTKIATAERRHNPSSFPS